MSVIVRQAVRGGPAELVLRIDSEAYSGTDVNGEVYVIYEQLTLNQAAQLMADLAVSVAGECRQWGPASMSCIPTIWSISDAAF